MLEPLGAPMFLPMRAGTVAVRALTRIVEAGVAAGIPRDVLIAAAGLTNAQLADVDGHVPLTAEIALWQMLAQRVKDPDFGIRNGAQFRVRPAGLLGYVMLFSATVRDALFRLDRYARIFTEAVQFRVREEGKGIALRLSHPELGAGVRFAQDYRLAALLAVIREVARADIVPAQVSFTYSSSVSTLAHREFFRCPIRSGAPTAGIVFRASDVDLPIPSADETLSGYLGKYADQVLASLLRGETFRHKVRAAIWSVLGNGTPSLQRVATVMKMPPRTLQRRLATERTTFHQELDEIRKTMAIATLRDHSVAIGDVAFLLGYSEPSAFYRSFKRWTKTTPRQFRVKAA